METVLLVAYLLIVLAMIAVILIQRSEGGGLGMGGNAGGLISVRGSANLLTRTTGILAALFFATAIGLTVYSSLDGRPSDILDQAVTNGDSTQPSTVLDALDQLQGDTSSSVAPDTNGLATPDLAVSEAPSSAAPADIASSAPADTTSSAPADAVSSAPAVTASSVPPDTAASSAPLESSAPTN